MILRTTATWTGFTGAPGYTNFYWSDNPGDANNVQHVVNVTRQFFDTWRAWLPTQVKIQVSPEVAFMNEATGMAEDFQTVATPDVVAASTSGVFAGPAGACISWLTSAVRNGRRVRGRTFLVPLISTAYEADGTLSTNAQTSIRLAADGLGSNVDSRLVVWSRPSARGAADGQAHDVIGYRLADKVAVLRSRRD